VPELIWRHYNQRADVENLIAELKYDLAADDFCLQEFFATEAAFCAILMLFNLLGEWQRASQMKGYRQPATLRAQVFLCGAVLGRAEHRLVLHLSSAWDGLEKRKPLLDNLTELEPEGMDHFLLVTCALYSSFFFTSVKALSPGFSLIA
jgi:hypothetical protein